jgi:hypothetical protein
MTSHRTAQETEPPAAEPRDTPGGRAPSVAWTLPERLAAAEQAEVVPRAAAMRLSAAYTAAMAAADHAEAARLAPLLAHTREELLIAEATTSALRHAMQTAAQEETERAQAAEHARRQEAAQAEIGQAIAAERQALAELGERIDGFWQAVGMCKAAYHAALACEQAAGMARQRQHDIRIEIGETEGGGKGPSAPNRASVLMDEYPMVRAIAHWQR